MKSRLLILLLLLLLFKGAYACAASENWGEDTDVFNKGFGEQKQISDTKLHKTVDMLKERALTKKQKKIRNEVKAISPAYDEKHLDDFANDIPDDDELKNSRTIMIPTVAYDETGVPILPGYYKLSCRKTEDNRYMLDLSQGTKIVMSVKAVQTEQDLERETLNFCESEIIEGSRIRLMYGSIDLNLVGYIYFRENKPEKKYNLTQTY